MFCLQLLHFPRWKIQENKGIKFLILSLEWHFGHSDLAITIGCFVQRRWLKRLAKEPKISPEIATKKVCAKNGSCEFRSEKKSMSKLIVWWTLLNRGHRSIIRKSKWIIWANQKQAAKSFWRFFLWFFVFLVPISKFRLWIVAKVITENIITITKTNIAI